MEPFGVLDSIACPFKEANIDTDRIVSIRSLKKMRIGQGPTDYGQYAFAEARFNQDGSINETFILNDPAYKGTQIIVASENFGCGSSRETAVWVLFDYGFRAILAPSFGDIFFSNCCKHGILPIVLPQKTISNLQQLCVENPGTKLRVDLSKNTVSTATGETFTFNLAEFARECLLSGSSYIEITKSLGDEFAQFETARESDRPWE